MNIGFLADCAREIRSELQQKAEEMVKRTGVRAGNSNLIQVTRLLV